MDKIVLNDALGSQRVCVCAAMIGFWTNPQLYCLACVIQSRSGSHGSLGSCAEITRLVLGLLAAPFEGIDTKPNHNVVTSLGYITSRFFLNSSINVLVFYDNITMYLSLIPLFSLGQILVFSL